MTILPEKDQQIIDAHTGLIHRVVIACQNPQLVPDLGPILKQAEDNGWTSLVATVRRILSGKRDDSLLRGLDEEDGIIVAAILRGLQNPQTLPDLQKGFDAGMAAPGIAAMIHGSRQGNLETLQLLSGMAQQMMQAGGDMARLAAILRPMIQGEREPEKLGQGMSDKGQKLVQSIVDELAKLDAGNG
jgi:hypothetical protein